MTKEEILKAIRACAKELGRNPSVRELRSMAGISGRSLYTRFGSLRKALESAGLEAKGPGFVPPESILLLDWAVVARKLKKVPSVLEYLGTGRFSTKPFLTRYGSWTRIARAFREFAGKAGLARKWRDVLEMIAAESSQPTKPTKTKAGGAGWRLRIDTGRLSRGRLLRGRLLRDRPVYGRPLLLPELAHAPVNEQGVIFLFGAMARRLGFVVHRVQAGFPDCIAMREVAPGLWQRVRVEFEFESRNFLKHRHRHDRCDVIVCWVHNWPGCPEGLDVVELSKEIG